MKRKRFEGIMSMVEAKVALNHLFEMAAQHRADYAAQLQEKSILQVSYQWLEIIISEL